MSHSALAWKASFAAKCNNHMHGSCQQMAPRGVNQTRKCTCRILKMQPKPNVLKNIIRPLVKKTRNMNVSDFLFK